MTSAPALRAEIARHHGVLRFPDPLEGAYRADYFERTLTTVRTALGLALAVYAVFGVLDVWIVPEARWHIWRIRYALVCPLVTGALVLSYSSRFRPVWRMCMLGALIVMGTGLLAMIAVAGGRGGEYYYAGLMLALWWAYTLSRLGFWDATFAGWGIVLAYEATAVWVNPVPFHAFVSNNFFLVTSNVGGMIACYHIEAAFRRDFLQRAWIAEKARELEEAAEKLRAAEARIAELARSAPESLEHLPAWVAPVARQVCGTIGARELLVWERRGDDLVLLAGPDGGAPAPDLLRAATVEGGLAIRGEDAVAVATGKDGEILGAIVVGGAVAWTDAERHLVIGFAQHLGNLIEILRMRSRVLAAEQKRAITARELRERGIATLEVCPVCKRCFDHTVTACPRDNAALVSHAIPQVPFGRYRLLRLLGQGGMGIVFEARDEKLDRRVALKVVRSEQMTDPALRERLVREAQAVARIDHPSVIRLHDCAELEDESTILVMEILEGRDVRSLLASHGRGTPTQVASFLRQVGGGIGAAHQAGIVHRDVKPHNIFALSTDQGWRYKVLDFGLAKALSSEATLTRTGMIVGTPAYMSPEQIRGGEVDARSDLYSLAVVTYEALVGRRLVSGNDLVSVFFSVVSEPAPRLSRALPGVPAVGDQIFAAALAKEPGGRPSSVEAWVDALVPILDRLPAEGPGWAVPSTHGPDAGHGDATTMKRVAGEA